MSVDLIELLFRKLRTYSSKADATLPPRPPYLVLIQHSLSFPLREQASSGTLESDETVYRRAGLRTPAESALRDLEGGTVWAKYMTQQMCQEIDSVVWLRTSTRRMPAWIQQTSNIHVIDAAKDPFGWMGYLEDGSANLEDLNSILHAIESHVQTLSVDTPVSSGLVIESLTPIIQRHGVDQTIRLMKRVRSIVSPVVVSVAAETMAASDHRRLESIAEAILSIGGGGTTLLRKGVRERDNVVRQRLSFNIITESDGQRSIEMLEEKQDDDQPKAVAAAEVPSADNERQDASSKSSRTRQKVELRLEDGDRDRQHEKLTDGSGLSEPIDHSAPRIFMDDDDPEFDDYDEEDPDDDLDI